MYDWDGGAVAETGWQNTGHPLILVSVFEHYGTTNEIAAMVAYLAGPEAGFVTGASLTING